MVRRLLLSYAVVELVAIVGLAWTIGWGWALLAFVGTFAVGVVVSAPIATRQLGGQLVQLRNGLKQPGRALGDGVMVSLAAVLVLVPGLVTTAMGMLLLVPPIRAAARPRLAAIAMRRFPDRAPLITDMTGRATPDYIDGEVIDVTDFEPSALPQRRA
jgi:UPF0716 protein FxsA